MSILSSTRAGAGAMTITKDALYKAGWRLHKKERVPNWYLDKTHFIRQTREEQYMTQMKTPQGSWFIYEMHNMAELHLFMNYCRAQGRKKYYFYKKIHEKTYPMYTVTDKTSITYKPYVQGFGIINN